MVKRIGLAVAALFAVGTAFLPGGALASEAGRTANMTSIAPQLDVLQAYHYGHPHGGGYGGRHCWQEPVRRCDYYGYCTTHYVTRCSYRGGYGGGYRGGY